MTSYDHSLQRELAPTCPEWKRDIERRLPVGTHISTVIQEFVGILEGRKISYTEAQNLVLCEYLRRALVMEKGNKCGAARRLGVHRNTVGRMLK